VLLEDRMGASILKSERSEAGRMTTVFLLIGHGRVNVRNGVFYIHSRTLGRGRRLLNCLIFASTCVPCIVSCSCLICFTLLSSFNTRQQFARRFFKKPVATVCRIGMYYNSSPHVSLHYPRSTCSHSFICRLVQDWNPPQFSCGPAIWLLKAYIRIIHVTTCLPFGRLRVRLTSQEIFGSPMFLCSPSPF